MIRKLLNILLVLSVIINFLLGGWLIFEEKKFQRQIMAQQINEKTLGFIKLFVEKVLNGQNEISFEDRLQLENNVRDLNDKAIFSQWQKFTKTKTNEDAQVQVGALFMLLLDKISY